MKMLENCRYTLENGILTLCNGLFRKSFEGVTSANASVADAEGLSLPYLQVEATYENGETRRYCLWNDLAALYMPDYREETLLELSGEHWIVRAIKLHAFTDENDTLTEEQEKHLFARNLFRGCTGDIFFLEDPQTQQAIVIISECPDYQTATLTVKKGVLSVENGGNGLMLGFCSIGECEALCREYYRHARYCRGLISMSNTWGDRNAFKRVCRDFILREIDAAKELGVDIVQIDDGWQVGSTADLSRRDSQGRREFLGDFWDLSKERFPNGMREITEYAAEAGIKIGLWFAPDSHGGFALLERDKAILRRAYEEWGFRFFKLDMFWVLSDTDRDRFLELLREIYSFGDDVAVQLDVTRNARMNYLCGRQYGTVFVENRYHRSGNSYPHRILRNLWMLGRYLPTSKFQFEMINPDLYTECYPENDPFVPSLYGQDYLFASVMLSNPLFWQEMQFLPQARREELRPIMKVWKEHRSELANADVCPIGEKPSGRSFTGFYISKQGKPKYLLLFREVTEHDSACIKAHVPATEARLLISNADTQVNVLNGEIHAKLAKPRAYAFFELL